MSIYTGQTGEYGANFGIPSMPLAWALRGTHEAVAIEEHRIDPAQGAQILPDIAIDVEVLLSRRLRRYSRGWQELWGACP